MPHLQTTLVIMLAAMAITCLPACKKPDAYMNRIKITGVNMTTPPCTPEFNAIWQGTNQVDSFVTISNTPASIGLNNATVFPVYMNINWTTHTPTCGGMITITGYQLQ